MSASLVIDAQHQGLVGEGKGKERIKPADNYRFLGVVSERLWQVGEGGSGGKRGEIPFKIANAL